MPSSNAASALSKEEQLEYYQLLEEQERHRSRRKWYGMFPKEGRFRRECYPKHLEFFRLGASYNERAFIAANRVGKTQGAAYEVTAHLIGEYPDWWEGRRFDEPIEAWVCGDTAKTTRDILQRELLGEPGSEDALGTGMIPHECFIRSDVKHGLASAVDKAFIRHSTGGVSTVQFLSYDQGRQVFQGTSKHVIVLDEECPEDIYVEALTRTLTVGGIVILTFTPLLGLTPLVLSFLPHLSPGHG